MEEKTEDHLALDLASSSHDDVNKKTSESSHLGRPTERQPVGERSTRKNTGNATAGL